MRIAVAGGTGAVGRHVVAAATRLGHEPVVLARSTGVDVVTGAGLAGALAGSAALIDVSNTATVAARVATAFFTAASTHLLEAGRQAGVAHHVALSIVGCDRVDFGYYLGKRAQERLVLADPRGSVLRATQFHEFAAQMVARSRAGVAVVPVMLSRPIAAAEVATALVELAAGTGRGLAPELAGPREERMPDLVRRYLRAHGQRRLVVPVRLPGAVGRAMATGGLLPTGDGTRGLTSYDDWLASGM